MGNYLILYMKQEKNVQNTWQVSCILFFISSDTQVDDEVCLYWKNISQNAYINFVKIGNFQIKQLIQLGTKDQLCAQWANGYKLSSPDKKMYFDCLC